MSQTINQNRTTLRDIQKIYRSQQKLTMLTAYDYVMAGLLDQAGIDMLLVGDSLGNVILGHPTTIPVKLEQMIHHAAAVVRGTTKAFVICDLPFGTYSNTQSALKSSIQIFQQTGAQAVKLEGGTEVAPIIRKLVAQGIPVMGHIGLTPQSVHQMGGYYMHGKTPQNAKRLLDEALLLQEAGAFSIVLECIDPELSQTITQKLQIPTIGIGSGPYSSGQVLVINDLLGLSLHAQPKFAKPVVNLAKIITEAALQFKNQVKTEPSENLK